MRCWDLQLRNLLQSNPSCLFPGVYEHIWAVLKDQDTPEMWGLGRPHQSRLVPDVTNAKYMWAGTLSNGQVKAKNDLIMSSIRGSAAAGVGCRG